MRDGDTGVYYGEHLRGSGRWGYSMCMLRTNSITGGASYWDPYLLAAWRGERCWEAVKSMRFTGYEWEPRWLRLEVSDAGIRCVNPGFELQAPADERAEEVPAGVQHGAVDVSFLPVTQVDRDGCFIDTEDRVQKCAAFLRDLVDARCGYL